ncbi:hypothetical protein PspS04_15790 [Pseudomonas sp. S04]|uniref:hypothetical protein n=1 Tax=unclassified Pseudomonas TaxID=196821 RepID=UPI00131F8301|nr:MULTISPECIES: hypothetical protein [unclassified Pseudomonas]QHD01731.1 hypothetical protein PspS04_15790 [Pseudomonas sp. S04]QHF34214.1 hypothetical protein PspS19_15795 [Pseudomonas sp. S19]
MNATTVGKWATCLLALQLLLMAGCSSKTSRSTYASSSQGSNCYAKALPTAGEGGLAWGSTLGAARQKSMVSCQRYAGRSGGTPSTCKVVLAKCKTR